MKNKTAWIEIAKFEWRVALRSKFPMINAIVVVLIQFFSIVFNQHSTNLSEVAALGSVQIGLLVISLLAIQYGVFVFRNEYREHEMLLSLPIHRNQIFLGRLMGNGLVYAVSVFIGFLFPLVFSIKTNFFVGYLLVIAFQILIGLLFFTIGCGIGILIKQRISALSVAVLVWIAATLGGDLLMIILTMHFNGGTYRDLLFTYLLLNPVAAVRSVCSMGLGGEAVYGAGGLVLMRWFGSMAAAIGIVITSTVVWCGIFFTIAMRMFRKAEFE